MPSCPPAIFLLLLNNKVGDSGNAAPTLSAGSVTINEDASGVITLSASDTDGTINWATLEVVSSPAHGTVNLNTPTDGQVTYTPAANNHTDVTFTLRVQDDLGEWSNTATMTVTINSVADAPVISGTLSAFNEDTSGVMTLSYSSNDSAAANWATLEQVGTNANLTLTLNYLTNGDIRVTPAANYNGSTSFQVRVQDANGVWSNTLTVSVTVNAVADNPVLTSPITFSFNEDVDGTLDIDSYYSSPDSTARRTTSGSIVCSTPTYGTLSINQSTGVITYSATDPNWSGSDSFTVYCFDANNLQSNTATVNVTVNAVNDAPTVFGYAIDTFENNAIVIPVADLNLALDIDNTINWTTVEIGTSPSHGSTSVNGTTGAITYLPAANNLTDVSFTWRVQDASGAWSPYATINVNILQSPIIQAMLANGVDLIYRGNELSGSTFADGSGNAYGSGTLSGSGITYNVGTPAATQRGTAPDGSPAIQITDATTHVNVTDTTTRALFSGTNWTFGIFVRDSDGTWTNASARAVTQIRENTGNEQYLIQVRTEGAIQYYIVVNTEIDDYVGSVETTTDWVFVAVSYDDAANQLAYYRNGTQVATDTTAATVSLDTANMSMRPFGNSATSASGLDLYGWFAANATLTTTQLANIYNAWSRRYQYSTLRQLGMAKGTHVGVAVPNGYSSKSSTFRTLCETEYTVMATENAAKYSTLYSVGLLSPQWSSLEQIVNAADAANVRHAIHPLFWHSDNNFIDNEIDDTKAAAQAEIIRRLDELRAKYDLEGWSEPYAIDVCNEIMADGSNQLRGHQWTYKFNNSGSVGTQTSAREWIDFCFIETEKRFPNSLLLLADYQVEKQGDTKGDGFYTLYADMVADGIPVDGVHFQGHWIHADNLYLYSNSVLTQINRIKAITNYRGKASYVGYSELDIRTTDYQTVDATVSASSTGSTLVASTDVFTSDMANGFTVINLSNGQTRTITGYTSATTVTVDSAINDTWDGHQFAVTFNKTGTASSSSSGTTLIATTSVFTSNMVGMSVMNTTDSDVCVITAYTNATTVTVSKTIGDTWDNDAFEIGVNAMWYNIMKNTAAVVDYIGFWNLDDDSSWLGHTNYGTLRDANLAKKSSWNYVAQGIYDAS